MPEEKKSTAAGVILGLVGGSAAAAVIAFFTNSSIERDKFSYGIMQQALQAEKLEDRVARLKFLIEMGFISDAGVRSKLEARIKSSTDTGQPPKPATLPQLPPASTPLTAPMTARPDLTAYKIQIFYPQKNATDQKEAHALKAILASALPETEIEVSPAKDTASDDQIRYDRGSEYEVATALQHILEDHYPQRRFRMQTVYTPTPNSLSIFFKSQ
jgi:hypothetical protein